MKRKETTTKPTAINGQEEVVMAWADIDAAAEDMASKVARMTAHLVL